MTRLSTWRFFCDKKFKRHLALSRGTNFNGNPVYIIVISRLIKIIKIFSVIFLSTNKWICYTKFATWSIKLIEMNENTGKKWSLMERYARERRTRFQVTPASRLSGPGHSGPHRPPTLVAPASRYTGPWSYRPPIYIPIVSILDFCLYTSYD